MSTKTTNKTIFNTEAFAFREKMLVVYVMSRTPTSGSLLYWYNFLTKEHLKHFTFYLYVMDGSALWVEKGVQKSSWLEVNNFFYFSFPIQIHLFLQLSFDLF